MAFRRILDAERLHALISAMLLIEKQGPLEDTLREIVKQATTIAEAQYGALGIVSSDGETLSRFITYGIPEDIRAVIGDLPHGKGLLGATIHDAASLRVDDLHADSRAVGFPEGHPDMTTFLGVPVRTEDGQIFGNLYLTNKRSGRPFTEEDRYLVETFGRAAGLVIDQAHLQGRLRELTLSEERDRLARDLHDTVIQRLFGIGLSLQMALGNELDEQTSQRINAALDDLDGTIHEIRTTIFEIDSSPGEGNLGRKAQALCDEVAARLGVQVHVAIDPEIDTIPSALSTQVVAAMREILSNIVRHSQATEVDVALTLPPRTIRLEVRDDGVGFLPHVGPGRGLRNLVSRARELGGECTVDANPGRGTTITWEAAR